MELNHSEGEEMNYYLYWMEWVLLASYVNVVVLTGGD